MVNAKLCPECGKEWNGLRCGDVAFTGQKCGGMTVDDCRCRVCGAAKSSKPAGLAGTALGVVVALPVLAVTAGVAAVVFWLALSAVHSLISWQEVYGVLQGGGYEVKWHLCARWLLVTLSVLILLVMAVSYAVRLNKE